MDYYVIGQRIRKYRKANRLSQEELAEKVGISITHMSHIETGNTKLSLPVLVKLSEELSVRTDDLLFDSSVVNKSAIIDDIIHVFEGCTAQQAQVLKEIVVSSAVAMDKYL